MEAQAKDAAKALKNRFRGKAEKFLKERRQQNTESESPPAGQDVDSFLHGPSDKLYMMPSSNNGNVPPLTRIDTSNTSRWPTATEINSGQRRRSTSPRARRGRKGLAVRFSDAQPEIIGEGGDESTLPVAEIGARKRAHSHPPPGAMQPPPMVVVDQRTQPLPYPIEPYEQHIARPPPLPTRPSQQNSRIDFDMGESGRIPSQPTGPPVLPEIERTQAGFMSTSDTENSFSARIQEMRLGEGQALVQAASKSSIFDLHFPQSSSPLPAINDLSPELRELHDNTLNNAQITDTSPDAPILNTPVPPPIPLKEHPASHEIVSPVDSTHHSISPSERNVAVSPPLSEHARDTPTPPINTISNIPPLLEVRKPSSPYPTPNSNRGSPLPTPYPTLAAAGDAKEPQLRPTTLTSVPSQASYDAVGSAGDEALQEFSRRSAHLYTLFRLSAESVKPLPKCSPQELVRVALWWFLKGRLNLETSIRERPANPEDQQANSLFRQQAHADLAKALWIIESVTAQLPQRQTVSTGPNTPMADLLNAQQTMLSSLKKLAVSMKRNNILPLDPDDAPLPQGVDNTIWVKDDGNRSLVLGQRFESVLSLSEAFSMGDSENHFQYGRMFVEAVLLEEAASEYYRAHVLLSVLRSQREKGLTVAVASQDGLLNIGVQHDKSRGPTWENVTWQRRDHTLDIKLARGFVLRLHCQVQDYEALWNLYDLHNEIYAVLDARENEELIFDTTVRLFQQFNLQDGESVPAPPLPNSYLRVFQRVLNEKSPAGLRKSHRGFRIGLCTNVKTKNVKGVDRVLIPNLPIQFGYLRGDNGLPALLLKSSDEQSQNNIVFTFEDANQRTQLHTLLTGLALRNNEEVISETAIKSFGVTNPKGYEAKRLKYLDWKSIRLINEFDGNTQTSKTVDSNSLRLVLDFKAGAITDRINVGSGELKLRLDVNNSTQLKILRQPQQDLTISVSESQVLKELPDELTDLLRIMGRYSTTRIYTFGDVHQLHLFQTALTGYKPLFDGIAASFSISRRRMVVPIYKKWDAATTRIQLVEKDNAVQLVAFFEEFSHGSCMNFALKSTDVFESAGRSGKFSVKIVDAKFALPRTKDANEASSEHEFVNLDMMEYPTEHDDVTIVFDAEADRERFAQALPAQVKHASRMPGFGK